MLGSRGIISAGTGSVNDICRVTAAKTGKRFCIYATAPSMDGFASDTAPIIKDNFKSSWQAVQPEVILADTRVLAKAPTELKSAGFGDMMAKYIGLCDWRISTLLTGEYYCDRIAAITKKATDKIAALADRITSYDEESAGQVMESLVMTGLAMKLAGCSRPASGAEHVVSHYLECHMLLRGQMPQYHGKKVGVATVILNRVYRNIANRVERINPIAETAISDEVYSHYDPRMHDDIRRMNNPTVTCLIDPEDFRLKWQQIRNIILETLPTDEVLTNMMLSAGAATKPTEMNVSDEFMLEALRWHPYMRYRVLLTRLLPMAGLNISIFL